MHVYTNQLTMPGAEVLTGLGFTPEQIARLTRLRECYPYVEWVDSRRQWDALLFLRWRYRTGHVNT